MDKLWKSKIIGWATKVKIFNSNVKAVLLYASESWTITQRMIDRLQVFINKRLRRILNIHWPDRTANKQLWEKLVRSQCWTKYEEGNGTGLNYLKKKCQHHQTGDTTRSQSKRRTMEYLEKRSGERNVDSRIQVYSWRKMEAAAQDRAGWRQVVCGLCSTGSDKA